MDAWRTTLWIVAGLGIVACWAVATFAWSDWEGAPSGWAHLGFLALFTLASAGVLALAMWGHRAMGVPMAFGLLLVGWLGTWAYGFLWVPGAAAVLACGLPRTGVPRAPPSVTGH